MKKFYCFRQGQDLPGWMWGIDIKSRQGIFKSKGLKIKFGVSCIAVRETGEQTKIIPVREGHEGIIFIKNTTDALMGGINGATGVHIARPVSNFGKGLKYAVTNSKVKLIKDSKRLSMLSMMVRDSLDTNYPLGLDPIHLLHTGKHEVVTVPNFKVNNLHDDFD